MLNNFCLTTEETNDNFVGIRFEDGMPQVVFPRGFNLPQDERELRKDVFRLLGVLQRFANKQEGFETKGTAEQISTLPIKSYQYIILDYLSNGYYVEKEKEYISSNKGRISWKRTIQKEKPQISNGNIVYLNFQTSRAKINENNLITQIHKQCVYESFRMFGWLYLENDFKVEELAVKLDRKICITVLRDKLAHTNNDAKKQLFQSMINILNNKHEDINYRSTALGVNHFAGVWERLINHVFGEDNIEKYFPRAQWHIFKNGKFIPSSALEPDTIMKHDGKIYILDAKYYQYGITQHPDDLPNTSSIQKQITYARHVHSLGEVDDPNKIYNAFLMPYDGKKGECVLEFVAVGSGGWEDDKNQEEKYNYSYILGILLDTRHLITTFSKHNLKEIEELADKIEESLEIYKKSYLSAENN